MPRLPILPSGIDRYSLRSWSPARKARSPALRCPQRFGLRRVAGPTILATDEILDRSEEMASPAPSVSPKRTGEAKSVKTRLPFYQGGIAGVSEGEQGRRLRS